MKEKKSNKTDEKNNLREEREKLIEMGKKAEFNQDLLSAFNVYQQAVEISVKLNDYESIKFHQTKVKDILKRIKKNFNENPLENTKLNGIKLFEIGYSALNSNYFLYAIEFFWKSIEFYPNLIKSWLGLIIAYRSIGDEKSANIYVKRLEDMGIGLNTTFYLNENNEKRILDAMLFQENQKETKITKESLLKNENRKNILDFIERNPACTLDEIMDFFKIGLNLATWHLLMLKKFGFIRFRKRLNKSFIFSNTYSKVNEKKALLMRDYRFSKILKVLRDNPRINFANLLKKTGISYNRLLYQIDLLEGCRLIIMQLSKNGEKTFSIIDEKNKIIP
ncbi:MAG: winged helix-turn-helix transcriptional regulator [Candidatus Lokiarchaeota archaeon]|nr:winged helix-turn-helix transcriptional regulator [Candidatus Lokiarchaeota archaeon]